MDFSTLIQENAKLDAKYFMREASAEDLIDVSRRLREADRQEVIANCGVPPELSIPAYSLSAHKPWVGGLKSDNLPEIIFGFDPIPFVPYGACCWMVSGDRIYDHAPFIMWISRRVFDHAHETYPLLTNFIDERNTRHIAWIKWLGFKFIRRIPEFGAQSRPFIEFASYRV
jgi:hypothetical protein